ncbi:hypothetical protein Tco_0897520 [Tanacetum coccineum]
MLRFLIGLLEFRIVRDVAGKFWILLKPCFKALNQTPLQGRLLASFQDDAKYEHVGQDQRLQDGKYNKDKQGKDLKISKQKAKSKDNDKCSRSKITKHEGKGYNMIKTKDSRTERQSNLNKLKEARFKISPQKFDDHILREIVSLKYVFEHGSSESA